MNKLKRTDVIHTHGIGIELFEIDAVMCHYCGKHEATGLRQDRKSGEEADVCSTSACLDKTVSDRPRPQQLATEQQQTLFS